MFYAYVLKSEIKEYYYKGHCQNLTIRLQQHNAGKTKSIEHAIPFRLVYHEEFETRAAAIKREKYFKSAAGRKFIRKMLGSLPE